MARSEEDRRFEEAKLLIDSGFQSAQSSDKAILTIATGAFGLSLFFLKEIAPILEKDSLWLLILSWILFAICIVTVLISFQTSQMACKVLLERIYLDPEKKNIWSTWTKFLNISSIVSLIIALALMGAFFYKNLLPHIGGEMDKKPKIITEGFDPIPIPKPKPQQSVQKPQVEKPKPQQPKPESTKSNK